jgi:hypothetical protein
MLRAERERAKEGGAGKESESKRQNSSKHVCRQFAVSNGFFMFWLPFSFTNLTLNSRNFHVIKELSRIIVFCADLEISVANLRGHTRKKVLETNFIANLCVLECSAMVYKTDNI